MIDLILFSLIGLSALIGVMRGMLATVLGMMSWVVAGWAAIHFGDTVALMLSNGAPPSVGDYGGGYALAFVGTLAGLFLFGMLLRSLVNATPLLRWPDRLLGLGLGVARGVLMSVFLVLVLGFTSITEKAAWRQSVLLPSLQPMAGWLRQKLPQPPDLGELPHAALMDLGKSVLAGDNARPNETDVGIGQPAALLQQAGFLPSKQQETGRSVDPARALPSNIDPAQVRPDHPDSTRAGAQGQARPPSR